MTSDLVNFTEFWHISSARFDIGNSCFRNFLLIPKLLFKLDIIILIQQNKFRCVIQKHSNNNKTKWILTSLKVTFGYFNTSITFLFWFSCRKKKKFSTKKKTNATTFGEKSGKSLAFHKALNKHFTQPNSCADLLTQYFTRNIRIRRQILSETLKHECLSENRLDWFEHCDWVWKCE